LQGTKPEATAEAKVGQGGEEISSSREVNPKNGPVPFRVEKSAAKRREPIGLRRDREELACLVALREEVDVKEPFLCNLVPPKVQEKPIAGFVGRQVPCKSKQLRIRDFLEYQHLSARCHDLLFIPVSLGLNLKEQQTQGCRTAEALDKLYGEFPPA
jgi:hypothetical protein